MTYTLMTRRKYLHLNDPRCYNGAYFDAEFLWGPWETLESNLPKERIDHKLKFWTELNDYAVSARGESAKREFKVIEGESK
jgi:hypothetical protein